MAPCSYQVTYAMIAMLGQNLHVKHVRCVSWDPLKCRLKSGALLASLLNLSRSQIGWKTVLSSALLNWTNRDYGSYTGSSDRVFSECLLDRFTLLSPGNQTSWAQLCGDLCLWFHVSRDHFVFASHSSWLFIHVASIWGMVSISFYPNLCQALYFWS